MLYGTMALSMIGSLLLVHSASGPHLASHSFSFLTALSNEARHSGGSKAAMSSDTADRPLNAARKSGGSASRWYEVTVELGKPRGGLSM